MRRIEFPWHEATGGSNADFRKQWASHSPIGPTGPEAREAWPKEGKSQPYGASRPKNPALEKAVDRRLPGRNWGQPVAALPAQDIGSPP